MDSFRFRSKNSPQTKFISKPRMSIPQISDKNMFLHPKQQKQAFMNMTLYSIVGDPSFKKKFFQQNLTPNQSISRQKQCKQETYQNTQISLNNPNLTLTLRQQSDSQDKHFNMYSTIYLDENQKRKMRSKFNKIQKNAFNRQNKALKSFLEKQKSWQQIQKNLKWQMKKNQTVTFTSVKKLYHHQNPQKIQIINDMIPQYWQKSLRDNDKKLKSHVKGNPFKKQLADQMLQTLSGNRKLQSCIPKIPISNTVDLLHKGFSLKGKRKQRQQNETMRSFQKTFYEETTKKINEFKQQRFPKKLKQLQNEHFLKQYNFSRDLQSLDKIDNQLFKRQFQRSKIWLNQGYDF